MSHQDKREFGLNLFALIANLITLFLGKRWSIPQGEVPGYLFDVDYQTTSNQKPQFFLERAKEKRSFLENLLMTVLRFILSYMGKSEEKKREKNNLALKGAKGMFENSK